MNNLKKKDQVVDQKTTGHSWDGIEEYANPDPFWLRILFYIMLFFSLIYWIMYPSWPTPNSIGFLGWSSEKELLESEKEIEDLKKEYQVEFDQASFEDILKNKKLLKFAIAGGKAAFENNCAPCHGVGGSGNIGYPNLSAGAWLWGGSIDEIYTTIKYGIRSAHDETRESQMASFGKDRILTPVEVDALTKYVMLIGQLTKDTSNIGNKTRLFAEHCSSCHGRDGKGDKEIGAPNLTDSIWLYGKTYGEIYDVIFSGRGGVMPYWENKLVDSTIRQLAIYVHQLGGGQ